MSIRRIDTWRITCTSCRHEFHDFAHDSEEMLDRMRKGGWRCEFDSGKGGWVYVCYDCVEAEKPQRPGDITHEEYEALTEKQKQQRRADYKAYMDRFEGNDYPVREQLNSSYQRYADSQRAEGYGPPGVYC